MMPRLLRTVLGVTLLCISLWGGRAEATFIEITNTGSLPITAVALNFYVSPFPPLGSAPNFQLLSDFRPDPTNQLFPPLDNAHPLLPGNALETYLVPELTGVPFEYIGGSLGSFGMAAIAENLALVPINVIPGVTVTDLPTSPSSIGLDAQLSFEPGGRPVPGPSTLVLLGFGLMSLASLFKRSLRRPEDAPRDDLPHFETY